VTEETGDILGTIRWKGIEGIIIPSGEDYGVIFTADPERMVITVPYEAVKQLGPETPKPMAEAILEPMFVRIGDMLDEMKSRDPE